MDETAVRAKARAERIWQNLINIDTHHRDLQAQVKYMDRISPEERAATWERLREFGLVERVETLANTKGLGMEQMRVTR